MAGGSGIHNGATPFRAAAGPCDASPKDWLWPAGNDFFAAVMPFRAMTESIRWSQLNSVCCSRKAARALECPNQGNQKTGEEMNHGEMDFFAGVKTPLPAGLMETAQLDS
jgi:hypothetical protein